MKIIGIIFLSLIFFYLIKLLILSISKLFSNSTNSSENLQIPSFLDTENNINEQSYFSSFDYDTDSNFFNYNHNKFFEEITNPIYCYLPYNIFYEDCFHDNSFEDYYYEENSLFDDSFDWDDQNDW